MGAKERLLVDVCWVSVDGVFVGGEYACGVVGEIVDAAGAALEALRRDPDAVVALVFGRVREGSQ